MTVTVAQKLRALSRANEVRSNHAALRKQMYALGYRGAAREAARILRDDFEPVASMEIGEFLLILPRFGKARAKRVLNECEITNPWRTIGSIPIRQRRALAFELDYLGNQKGGG